MRKNIKVLLHGGLGNQLFMYAAGKSLHRRKPNYNLEYKLNVGLWSKKSLQIDFFLKIKNYTHYKEISFFEKLMNKIPNQINSVVINDPYSTLDINEVPSCDNYILDGYFQNHKWYKETINQVLDEIIFSNKEKFFDKYPENDLTIVFRKSDYTKLGWELNIDYYLKSIELINENKNKKITISSEDVNFSKIFAKFLQLNNYKITEQSFDTKENPILVKDLCSIVKSKSLIMSNSSFCWWAAMIRSRLGYSNEEVICPKFWYPEFETNLKNSHPGNPNNWILQSNNFI